MTVPEYRRRAACPSRRAAGAQPAGQSPQFGIAESRPRLTRRARIGRVPDTDVWLSRLFSYRSSHFTPGSQDATITLTEAVVWAPVSLVLARAYACHRIRLLSFLLWSPLAALLLGLSSPFQDVCD